MGLARFKLIFSKEVYDPLIERIFEAAVKLILNIFDKEDVQRICNRFKIMKEHAAFYRELYHKDDHSEAISGSKSKFRHLWESDVYDALHQIVDDCKFTKLKPLKLDYTVRKMDPSYVSKAPELMKKYVPLKAHLKMQLLLEHAELKCFHVTDALVLQAIHSVDLPRIIGDFKDNEEKLNLLSELADDMFDGFNDITMTKANEVNGEGYYVAWEIVGTKLDEIDASHFKTDNQGISSFYQHLFHVNCYVFVVTLLLSGGVWFFFGC